MQADKTLLPLWKNCFSSFFSFYLPFNSSKNCILPSTLPPQHHTLLSFFSISVQDFFNYSIYICNILFQAVPLRIFPLHVWGVYPCSRPKGPKTETTDWTRFQVLEEGAANPLSINNGIWGSAVSSPMGQRIQGSARGQSQRYNKCMQFEIASSQHRNDCSGADTDILGPRSTFFGFDGAPEWHSSAFRLSFTTVLGSVSVLLSGCTFRSMIYVTRETICNSFELLAWHSG